MKLIKTLCVFWVLMIQSLPTSATTVIEQQPGYNTGLFEQKAEDLRLKVMGGYIYWYRNFQNGYWGFNPEWNNISYGRIKVVNNNTNPKSASSSSYNEDRTVLIRNDYEYKLDKNAKETIFRFDNDKYIEKTPEGFIWRNRATDWITYDHNGVILSYGNKEGVIASFGHDQDSRITTVNDRFGELVLTIGYTGDNITSIEDKSGRKVAYLWESGTLQTVTDVSGNDWNYRYNSYSDVSGEQVPHAIASFTDAEQRTWTFSNIQVGGKVTEVCTATGIAGEIVEVVDPDTGQVSITEVFPPGVENCKNVIIPDQIITESATDNDKNMTKYAYAYHNETKAYFRIETDPAGIKNQTFFGRDGAANKILRGDQLVLSRVKVKDTLKIMDADGNITTLKYNDYNQPVKITHPDNSYKMAEYHPSYNFMTRMIDENGIESDQKYDQNGFVTQMIKAKGTPEELVVDYSYNENGLVASATYSESMNHGIIKYVFDYDEKGNLTKETINDDIVWEYHNFTVTGHPQTIIDGRKKQWKYEYDKLGRMVKETNPNNKSKQYIYDNVGNLIIYINGNGGKYRYEYNHLNEITKVINPDESSVFYGYSSGVRTSEINEEGDETYITLDRAGRPYANVDANNNKTVYYTGKSEEFESSVFDNIQRVDYPTYSQLNKYTNRNQISQVTLLDGEQGSTYQMRYDPVGNLISRSDANGHRETFDYNAYGQLVGTNQSGRSTAYEYTAFGELLRFTDRNQYETRFEYDAWGRMVRKSRDHFGDWQFSYDFNDNLTQIIDAKGQRIDYRYDGANQLVEEQWYKTVDDTTPYQTVTFNYDNEGNITGWASGETSGIIERDTNGRLIAETTNYGSFSKTYRYSYYNDGMTKTLSMPDGTIYTYHYDKNNQLVRLQIPGEGSLTVNEYNWTAPAKETLPGGVSRVTTYTGLLAPKSIDVVTAEKQPVMKLGFDYGLVQELLERNNGQEHITYQYDDIYRLEQAVTTGPDGFQRQERYQLDDNSNRLSTDEEANWEYNSAGQLIKRGDVSYEYDAQGNQIKRTQAGSEIRYVYDAKDRLIQVLNDKKNLTVVYQYDPFDRRISKNVNGVTTYYLYNTEGLLAEYDKDGREASSYGYRPDSMWGTNPVFMRSRYLGGQEYFYYQNDHLGTPYQLTDTSGHVVWQANFDSFGNVLLASNNLVTNNLRFPGQYFDAETGLHYNWRRYYDPEIGRYITPDPIDLNGGSNLYTYVSGDPINSIDPNGECGIKGVILGVGETLLNAWLTGDCFSYGWLNAAKDFFCYKWLKRIFKGIWGIISRSNSFPEYTLVHTENGLTPIKDIKKGDRVLSYAEWNSEESYQSVEDVIVNTKEYDLVVVTLETGEEITATDGHPLYILGSGWVEARDVRVGQQVYLGEQGALGIAKVAHKSEEMTVYNLDVANTNTFFIGESKMLVHNIESNDQHTLRSAQSYEVLPTKSSMISHKVLNKHVNVEALNTSLQSKRARYFTAPIVAEMK